MATTSCDMVRLVTSSLPLTPTLLSAQPVKVQPASGVTVIVTSSP